eukprot:1157721-Pelagomonas_calceolata.AAC.6
MTITASDMLMRSARTGPLGYEGCVGHREATTWACTLIIAGPIKGRQLSPAGCSCLTTFSCQSKSAKLSRTDLSGEDGMQEKACGGPANLSVSLHQGPSHE